MTDDRRHSTTSDDLVREARERSHGEGAVIDDFVPSSPADTYTLLDVSPAGTGTPADDDRTLTAEEIARALAEAAHERSGSEPDRAEEPADVIERDPVPLERPRMAHVVVPPTPRAELDAGEVDTRDPGSPVSSAGVRPAPPADFVGDRWSTSTPEWEEWVATRPVRKSRVKVPRLPAVRTMIGLAVAGFVALGLVVSWLDGRQAIDSLDVGACFTVGDTENVYDVPVVDCAEPHDSELFALVTVTGFGDSHPGDEALFTWLFDQCVDRFPAYVGESYESSDYWIDMLIPTPEGWGQGDRVGMCTAIVVDEDLNIRTSTGSARNAGTEA